MYLVTGAVLTLALLAGWPGSGPPTEARFPCRQPQLAASGRDVYLVCGTPSGSIALTRSSDGGGFGALTKVADTGALALGNHRGPRVALAGNTVVVSAIVGRPDATRGTSGDLTVWRSQDRGQTWSPPLIVNDVADAAREGLHAIAADGSRVVLVWLDLRHGRMALMSAFSTDSGRTWATDRLAFKSDSAICTCCHPSVAVSGTRVVAMFRNDHEGARDMFVVESADGGATWGAGTKIGAGTWPLKMCPMDGGALALDAGGRVIASWRRDQTVYVGTHGHERAVGPGINPAMVLAGTTPVIAWNGPDGLQAQWGRQAATLLDARGKFAALAVSGPHPVVAFEVGDESVVRGLPVPHGTAP